jgi:transcriptional regulator
MMTPITDTQRESIITLHQHGIHTQGEIAYLVGTTQGNVSKVLTQARRCDPAIRNCGRGRTRIIPASQLGTRRVPLNLDRV